MLGSMLEFMGLMPKKPCILADDSSASYGTRVAVVTRPDNSVLGYLFEDGRGLDESPSDVIGDI
jgi:hypothetical protein